MATQLTHTDHGWTLTQIDGEPDALVLAGSLHVTQPLVLDAPVVFTVGQDLTGVGGIEAQGVRLADFQVPAAPIPYDATPTAASLRDALVAAGYMAAPEGE